MISTRIAQHTTVSWLPAVKLVLLFTSVLWAGCDRGEEEEEEEEETVGVVPLSPG